MVFAFATDDRTLFAFPSEADAAAYAEGVDVEDGMWLFFAQDGTPLEPVFTTPNETGRFTVGSGVYRLERASGKHAGTLLELLPQVASVEGELASVEAVRQLIVSPSCGGGQDKGVGFEMNWVQLTRSLFRVPLIARQNPHA
jgi:hypothetical protein